MGACLDMGEVHHCSESAQVVPSVLVSSRLTVCIITCFGGLARQSSACHVCRWQSKNFQMACTA